jgi:hypothetical protein
MPPQPSKDYHDACRALFPTTVLILAATIAAVATSPVVARQKNDSIRNAYLALIDDSCRNYRVALAFPRSEHDRIKAAVKAEGEAGPYAKSSKEFELDSKVAGVPGACDAAARKANVAGADATILVSDKQFLSMQSVTMLHTAQLRAARDLCKRLAVDMKAVDAEMEKHGLDASEKRVKKYLKRISGDEWTKHKRNPAPFCLDMYAKWSPSGVVKTKE